MAMDENVLKENLNDDFILIFNICAAGAGMSAENFADMMAEAIASRTVEHIKAYAELAGTAGPYPIEGTVS